MKRQRQEEEGENFTLDVPDEILWHIFQYAGTLWSAYCGSHVCGAWARVVRTHCLCIDEQSVALRTGHLRRVPNLRTLKKWFCVGSRSNGFSSLTALTTLHIEDEGLGNSNHVLTMLRSLVNLTVVGAHYIVPSLMTSLRSLDISRNLLVTDETISALTGLQELRVVACPTISVECASTLTMLRSLAISRSGMRDATLWHLTGLTSLRLSYTNDVTKRSLARLTQLNDLALIASSRCVTTDDLLGLPLLTRLVVDGATDTRDYTALTTLRHLELYSPRPHPLIPLNEQNYHLMISLVIFKCHDTLCLSPEWIKKMPRLRELSVGLVTMAPHTAQADLAQFVRLEGNVTRGNPKVSLLKGAFLLQ